MLEKFTDYWERAVMWAGAHIIITVIIGGVIVMLLIALGWGLG